MPNEQQDAQMVIDYSTVWDAVEASINLSADEKIEVQTLLRTHAYPLAAQPDGLRAALEALAEHLVTRDGPHPFHDHLCPDGIADEIHRAVAGAV